MLNVAKYAAVAALAAGLGVAAKPPSAWGYTWGYSCGEGCGYGYGAFGPFPYGFYPYGYDGYPPYYRTSPLPVLRPQAIHHRLLRPQAIHHRRGRHRGPPLRPAGRDRPWTPAIPVQGGHVDTYVTQFQYDTWNRFQQMEDRFRMCRVSRRVSRTGSGDDDPTPLDEVVG